PIGFDPSNSLTVELASAVPVSTSVLSLVMPSPATPLSVVNEVMLGAVGAAVSTVTFMTADAALVTPETVSVAFNLWSPSGKGAVTKFHAPLAFAVAVPSSVVPSETFTVLFATAVPVSVRIAGSVMPSPTTPVSGENEVITGAPGGAVTVTARAPEATPVLPAASGAVAVRLCAPLVSAAVA